MDNANFIPLGNFAERASFDTNDRPQGRTKDERKRIAREIRLAAKREKKKIKSDAKKQRKLNAILHRRATRNNEKYVKNKDRNRSRAIALERHRVRMAAVRQAENLAAKYDPSGKSFNVGAVFTLEDGAVRSVERARLSAEKRAAEEAAAKFDKSAELQQQVQNSPADSVNPQRVNMIENLVPRRMSKKQQKRLALYAPKPVPPRPVLPEGISIPEGEEDFISQFDISDDEILKRLSNQKKEKSQAARALRVKQKQESKFRKAMKLRKKAADRLGVLFDAEAAKREILGLDQEDNEEVENKSGSGSNSESTSDSDSTSGSDSDSDDEEEEEEEAAADEEAEILEEPIKSKFTKQGRKVSESSGADQNGADHVEDVTMINTPFPGNKSLADGIPGTNALARKKPKRAKSAFLMVDEATADKVIKYEARKENRRLNRQRRRHPALAALAATAENSTDRSPKASKKRKHEEGVVDVTAQNTDRSSKISKKRKIDENVTEEPIQELGSTESHKKKTSKTKDSAAASNGHNHAAEQWNAEALQGDTARKEKFLRLLGAGKSSGTLPEPKQKSKSKTATKDAAEISRVESELQRQFEAGVKMKYDGQGKRKGLGA